MTSIKEYLKRCVDEGAFPGAAWVIGRVDSVLEQGSVGFLGKGLATVTAHTLYDIASLTKVFTALTIMKQLEDGLLRLEDELAYFLPDFKNSPLGKTTIFALMTHTAPINKGNGLHRYAKTKEELLQAIAELPLRSDSPDKVAYTCESFILLGEIASVLDNAPLDVVIQNRVLHALEMKETRFNPPVSLLDRIAPTEDCPVRGKLIHGTVHDEKSSIMGGVSGNAGLFSTSGDMAILAAAMLRTLASGDFLSKASAALMVRNHTAGKGENRGLGWIVAGPDSPSGDLMSSVSFGHTGFTGGSIWIDPERDLYAVLLANRIYPDRENPLIFRTRHIFHNLAVAAYST